MLGPHFGDLFSMMTMFGFGLVSKYLALVLRGIGASLSLNLVEE